MVHGTNSLVIDPAAESELFTA